MSDHAGDTRAPGLYVPSFSTSSTGSSATVTSQSLITRRMMSTVVRRRRPHFGPGSAQELERCAAGCGNYVAASGSRTSPHRIGVLRGKIRRAATIPALVAGVVRYLVTGQTGEAGYQAMVRLYCVTGGASNSVFHAAIRMFRRPYPTGGATGILRDVNLDELAAALDRDGYAVLPTVLDVEMCDRLTAWARDTPGSFRPALPSGTSTGRFDETVRGLETCWLHEIDLAAAADIQTLLGDPSLLMAAQAYLRCKPVVSALAMWWSVPAPGGSGAEGEKAQMFHFDLDRIKWLKFFVYLTDVTAETGPHVYIRGSHRRAGKPTALLRHGYRRLNDDEIRKYYSEEDIIEIVGPRGTIFAADTSGFHKGKPPVTGSRLVLQIEYADSMYGGRYETVGPVAIRSTTLETTRARFGRVTSRLRFDVDGVVQIGGLEDK